MKLFVFDVDGTISDSQAHILHAMTLGFEAVGLPAPNREAVLSIVGLSLPQAVAELVPGLPVADQDRIVEGYKQSYFTSRAAQPAPLYPGARDLLMRLAGREGVVLGVATGKSRRGLDALIKAHALEGVFDTLQVADDHPSKPHPEMLMAALAETGVGARDAVMIGDTSFDIEMGRAAGTGTIGVRWGYHPVDRLMAAGADRIVDTFEALEGALDAMLEVLA